MRRALLIAVAVVASLAVAPAAMADTWGTPLTVPRSTTAAVPTQLLFTSAGRASVAAAGHYGGKGQILRSEQFTDGQFLQFGRGFSGTSTQGIQGFAYDARGNGVMAGLSVPSGGGRAKVTLRATRQPGSQFGPRQEYSPGETQATTMRIAIGEGGSALVTWVARIHGEHRIAYVMRQPGHRFGSRHLLSFSVPASRHLGFHIQPHPAVDEHGNMAVTWSDATDQRVAVGTVRGGFASSQDLGRTGGSTLAGSQPVPVALGLRGGRGIVAYVARVRFAWVVRVAVSPRIGSGFGGTAELPYVSGGMLGPELDPAAAVLGDGSYVLVARSDPNARIDAWTAGPDGVFGAPQVISPPGGTPGAPSLAGSADGRAIVAYGLRRPTGPASVMAATHAPGSRRFDAATLVASPSRLLDVVAGIGAGGRVGVAYNDGAVRVSLGSAG